MLLCGPLPRLVPIRINFDGASFRNPGPTGYGCLMHDHDGAILWVKGGPLGHCDAI